jgi:hypothetical protein
MAIIAGTMIIAGADKAPAWRIGPWGLPHRQVLQDRGSEHSRPCRSAAYAGAGLDDIAAEA